MSDDRCTLHGLRSPFSSGGPSHADPGHPRVLVASDDPELRLTFQGFAHGVVHVRSIVEAPADEVGSHAADVVVVGSRTGGRIPSPLALGRLRTLNPRSHIVVCLAPYDAKRWHLRAYARAGVDRVIVLDHEDRCVDVRRDVQRRLAHVLPPDVRLRMPTLDALTAVQLAGWCARNAFRSLRVGVLANHFAVDRKTACRNAKGIGWRDCQQMIWCARLLHVAAVLDRTDLTVGRIAERLDFEDAGAVCRLVRRTTGLTPRQLRNAGALDAAVRIWDARKCPPHEE